MIIKRFTLVTVKDDHGTALGIEMYEPTEGSGKELQYIASILIDEEISGHEALRRGVAACVRIAGEGVDVIRIKSPDPRAHSSRKRIARDYANVLIRQDNKGLFSTHELAYDALRRASEGREHLTIEEDLRN